MHRPLFLSRVQALQERELQASRPWQISKQDAFFRRVEYVIGELEDLCACATSPGSGYLRTVLGELAGVEADLHVNSLRNSIRDVGVKATTHATLKTYWEMAEPLFQFREHMLENKWDDFFQGSARYHSRLCRILVAVEGCINDLSTLPPSALTTGFILRFTPDLGDPLNDADWDTSIVMEYGMLSSMSPSLPASQTDVLDPYYREEIATSRTSTRLYLNSQTDDMSKVFKETIENPQWSARIQSSILQEASDEWRSVFLYLNAGHGDKQSDNFDQMPFRKLNIGPMRP